MIVNDTLHAIALAIAGVGIAYAWEQRHASLWLPAV